CTTAPNAEPATTAGSVDADEVPLRGNTKPLFTGGMSAASPGLHAVEHPIYDVWLTNCKGGSTVVADTQPAAPGPTQSAPAGTGRPQGQPPQRSAAAPAGTPPAGATAGAAPAPPAHPPARPGPQAQRHPAPAQAPDALQPLPPPPGSTPVQWPPRR